MLFKLQQIRNSREEGFTLIELLVVIVIIGVLAAIALPLYNKQQRAALRVSYKADLRNIVVATQTMLVKNPTAVDINPTAGTYNDAAWRKANPFNAVIADKIIRTDNTKESASFRAGEYSTWATNDKGNRYSDGLWDAPSYKKWAVAVQGGYIDESSGEFTGDIGWGFVYESYTGKFTEYNYFGS